MNTFLLVNTREYTWLAHDDILYNTEEYFVTNFLSLPFLYTHLFSVLSFLLLTLLGTSLLQSLSRFLRPALGPWACNFVQHGT